MSAPIWWDVTPLKGPLHIGLEHGAAAVRVNLVHVTHMYPLSDDRGTRLYFDSGADQSGHAHNLDILEPLRELPGS